MDLYLAPINSLSTYAFRKLCTVYEADYVFTEMVWAERIIEGNEYEEKKLAIDDEKMTIIQMITEDTKNIEPFLKIIKKRFPNVPEINFNMGCPQSSLSQKCIGGGILKDKIKMREYSSELFKACNKYGFKSSLKIRTGVDFPDLQSYIDIIKEAGVSKVYIHARTLTQGYVKAANYDPLKGIEGIEIVVNGDVTDITSFNKAISVTTCSGVLIGRAALNDPTIFLKLKSKPYPSKKEVILKFLSLSKDTQIATVKRNLSWLTMHIVGGASVRAEINDAKTVEDIEKIVEAATI